MSALIFVALAVVWALYLIPRALGHQDELARTRRIEKFSDSLRVLTRDKRSGHSGESASEAGGGHGAQPSRAESDEEDRRSARRALPTRAAARRAAKRRQNVLTALLLLTAVVAGLSASGVIGWWPVAVPAGMIVVFLVVARLTVRRERAARRAGAPEAPQASSQEQGRSVRAVPASTLVAAMQREHAEAEVPVVTEEQIQDVAGPVEEDGSLWDPLPLTLPTYVNKATAARTVRTIDLTTLSSSGHDAADSELAARNRETERDERAEQPRRRAAGA